MTRPATSLRLAPAAPGARILGWAARSRSTS